MSVAEGPGVEKVKGGGGQTKRPGDARRCEGGSLAERDRLERSDNRIAGSPAGEIKVQRFREWETRD